MAKPRRTYDVFDLSEAAVLKAAGVPFIEAVPDGRIVRLVFDDTDGRATEIALAHSNDGVTINSAKMAAGYAWAKDRIFATRRMNEVANHR